MKVSEPELLPSLRAVRLHCGGRGLTERGEQETIVRNRSGETTYPEGKSVSRSGATPLSGNDLPLAAPSEPSVGPNESPLLAVSSRPVFATLHHCYIAEEANVCIFEVVGQEVISCVSRFRHRLRLTNYPTVQNPNDVIGEDPVDH